MLGSQLRHT